MRSRAAWRAFLALVALVVLVPLAAPLAHAALNDPRPYAASHPYMPELDAPVFTMVSGRLEASMAEARGTFGFVDSDGASLTGLTRVCWTQGVRQCADSAGGTLRIDVQPGGSFGVRLPAGFDARLEADHALAMFVDLEGEADLNSLPLGKSVLAPVVGGTVRLDAMPSIPQAATHPADFDGDDAGGLSAIDAVTRVEVRDGSALRATLVGKSDPLTFAGRPQMGPVGCELAVLPFLGAGHQAFFERAGEDAARVGLDLDRVNSLMDRLYNANAGQPTDSAPVDSGAFGPFEDAVAAVFGGAVLSLPTQGTRGADVAFARVTTLQVRSTAGEGLAWSGRADLDVRDGHVAGAKDLAGFGFVQMPWWAWVLWVAALAVWVTRLVRKPVKEHPRWDRFKWVGWVASPLVFLFVLWLWDLELRAVLGVSLLSGTASGQLLVLVLALALATFALASFAAIVPLRLLLRNGSLLLGQGTFMGLAGAVASLLGFLLIATYLRAYLDVLVAPVLAGIG